MRPTCKTSLVVGSLVGAAALLLYGIAVHSVATMKNQRFSMHRNPFYYQPSADNSSSSRSWISTKGDNCLGSSSTNPSVRPLPEFNDDIDWQVFRAFASRNVSSPKGLELLSPAVRVDISKEVGLAFDVAARLLRLCYNYIRSFNRCDYRLLSDPGPCSADAAATGVIVVHSLPTSSQRRKDIRARLLGPRLTGYRLVFLLGRSQSTQAETDVQKEAAAYGDIIWADFIEDYDNLTIKTLVMLRWMEQNCLSARYVVKADDDVYLKMENLDAVLTLHLNKTRIIMGTIGYGEGVYRQADEKWYMPMYMFSSNRYPPFAHGPSYVISTDLIVDLNKAALTINYMHLEDIFIAVCASTLTNVRHVHIPAYISGSCSVSNAVAMHGLVCS